MNEDSQCDGYTDMLTLPPSEILYSHDSIGCRFTNGIPLTCVFAHLINGSLKVTDIPEIEVLSMNGGWWTVTGNRRLFLYRMLEEVGVIDKINVAKSAMNPTSHSFTKNFTNAFNGTQVSCRQKSLQPSLNEIVAEWQSGKDVIAKWDPLKQVPEAHAGYQEDEEEEEEEQQQQQQHQQQQQQQQQQHEDEDDDQDEEYYRHQYQYQDADDDTDESYHYNETGIHYGGVDSNSGYYEEDDWDDYYSHNEDQFSNHEEQDENDDEDAGNCNVM